MVDLSLDLSSAASPTYKDLLVLNNDLVLTSDANPAGTNNILQDVLQTISLFMGEFFMDNTQGVPYFQRIFIKNPKQSTIDAIFKNKIMGVPGVKQLTRYSFLPNFLSRSVSLSFVANTTSGPVSYTGTIASTGGIQNV